MKQENRRHHTSYYRRGYYRHRIRGLTYSYNLMYLSPLISTSRRLDLYPSNRSTRGVLVFSGMFTFLFRSPIPIPKFLQVEDRNFYFFVLGSCRSSETFDLFHSFDWEGLSEVFVTSGRLEDSNRVTLRKPPKIRDLVILFFKKELYSMFHTPLNNVVVIGRLYK